MPFPRRLTAAVLATMVCALALPAGAQEESLWQSVISVSGTSRNVRGPS